MVSVPLVRERNSVVTSEILLQTFNVLAFSGGAFVQLSDAGTGAAFSFTVSPLLKVRLARLSLSALDMIAFVTPLLRFRLAVDTQPLAPWDNVPLFPAAGAVKPVFDMNVLLKPGQTLTAFAANSDLGNKSFGMYLYGWQYPADYIDGAG